MSFFGGHIVGTELIKNDHNPDQICQTRIHFPVRPTQDNGFSAYQDTLIDGFIHIGPISHGLVLLDKSNCRGFAHELWLLRLDDGELTFIGIPK